MFVNQIGSRNFKFIMLNKLVKVRVFIHFTAASCGFSCGSVYLTWTLQEPSDYTYTPHPPPPLPLVYIGAVCG